MITAIVPSQNFELVRDRIGSILASEVANQAILMNAAVPNSGDYLASVKVTIEESTPIDKVTVPTINVNVISDDFSNKHQGKVDGQVQYAIDVYTSAKSTDSSKGSKLASIRLQKLLGLCRYILEDSIYKTLLFTPGMVGRTWCGGFQLSPIGENDAGNQAMGRLTFNVLCKEENTLLPAVPVVGSTTTVTLDNTTIGYAYTNNF